MTRPRARNTPGTLYLPAGIALGQALKAGNLVGSGGEAKILIQEGEVRVNGEVETRRGRRLHDGDVVVVGDEETGIERLEIG